MGAPWTISPVSTDFNIEIGDVIRVTLEGGESRVGIVSEVTLADTPEGGLSLTLWADPSPADDPA